MVLICEVPCLNKSSLSYPPQLQLLLQIGQGDVLISVVILTSTIAYNSRRHGVRLSSKEHQVGFLPCLFDILTRWASQHTDGLDPELMIVECR